MPLLSLFAIPLAWLQLKRERVRLLVALAGIGFAVVLMFMQLGFRAALFKSSVVLHENLNTDIVLVSPKSTALIAMETFPRQRLYQALGFPGVTSVSPLYLGFAIWKNPVAQTENITRSILVIGTELDADTLTIPGFRRHQDLLKLTDTALFDRLSREEFGPVPALLEQRDRVVTELNDRRIEVRALFDLGASFAADGNIITSDLNFLRIFSDRNMDEVDVGLIRVQPNANLEALLVGMRNVLPPDVVVFSKQGFLEFERNYWSNSTAIGFIFSLGTLMGFIVGTVIVYQILYTDVSDHLAEYATLKAMGYKNRYLLSVVFQEALILSVLGFAPAFLICLGLYNLTESATNLPVSMSLERTIAVFLLTLLMCCISGAIAVRKVQDADPADIF